MPSFGARMVVLSCGLLLALPPGWCCIFATLLPTHDAPVAAPACRSCCRQFAPSSPTPKPKPHNPERCPCADRHATTLDHVKSAPLDLSFVVVLPAVERSFLPSPMDAAAAFSPPPSASPQLIHCVWLC